MGGRGVFLNFLRVRHTRTKGHAGRGGGKANEPIGLADGHSPLYCTVVARACRDVTLLSEAFVKC